MFFTFLLDFFEGTVVSAFVYNVATYQFPEIISQCFIILPFARCFEQFSINEMILNQILQEFGVFTRSKYPIEPENRNR